jgi:hypothetical protein
MIDQYPVVTLCGSTRFKAAFTKAQKELTLAGNIVISVGLFGHSGDDEVWESTDENTLTVTKAMLDDMHKRKIDMADSIFVINVGGYIGESTRSEIEYAMKTGKAVQYLETQTDEKLKTQAYKATLTGVRARISEAKRKATHKGFIGWSGCTAVCDEMRNIVDTAQKYLIEGSYHLALSIATLIIISATKLAETADDSDGGVTMAIDVATEFIENICKKVKKGTQESEAVFEQGLKDAQNSIFDGWSEFPYMILQPIARLTTADNLAKLETTLKKLAGLYSTREYSSYEKYECLVRYAAIKSVSGQSAADEFAEEHLDNEEIRILHFDRMLLLKNYVRAEQLCREIIGQNNPTSYSTDQWITRLLDVYQKSGNRIILKQFLHGLLFQGHKTKYYDQLKALLVADGEWERDYSHFLEQVKGAVDAYSYMRILEKEQEWALLMIQLRENPDNAYTFAECLVPHYPQEIYAMCVRKIVLGAREASDRNGYRRIGADIKKLYTFGGQLEALNVVETLKQNYPRRPSLKDELDIAVAQMVHGMKHRKK